MKLFNIVEPFLKSKEEELGSGVKINEEKLEILGGYCEIIDGLMKTWGSHGVEVDLFSENRYVLIGIEVDTFAANPKGEPEVIELIDKCVCFATGVTEFGHVRIDFTFPSVFD